MKYIDQSNVTNACWSRNFTLRLEKSSNDHDLDVSGMREDLKMFGNEYNYMLSKETTPHQLNKEMSNIQ